MIYDLKELGKQFDELDHTGFAVEITSGRALLAIAERLEALVEVQGTLCEIQQKVLWQIESDK